MNMHRGKLDLEVQGNYNQEKILKHLALAASYSRLDLAISMFLVEKDLTD